jgi:hypothetical protein
MPAAARPLASTLESLGVTFRVISEQTVGDGRVVWLDVQPAAAYLGGAVDLAIEETGTVARLLAKNKSARPVLVPSDLVVGGGKQTRTVERSIVVPANAEVGVPVRCVEKNRWDPGRGAGDFRVEGTLSSVTRASFAKQKRVALESRGSYALDQQSVWAEVREELTRSGVTSTTESYADFLRETKPPPARVAIDPPAGANAVALYVEGTAWIEALPSEALLRVQATSMLDDFRRRAASGSRAGGDAIADAWRTELVAIDRVEGTVGDAYAVRGDRAVGSALFVDGALAHLAVAVG